jgi:hypothetical protein
MEATMNSHLFTRFLFGASLAAAIGCPQNLLKVGSVTVDGAVIADTGAIGDSTASTDGASPADHALVVDRAMGVDAIEIQDRVSIFDAVQRQDHTMATDRAVVSDVLVADRWAPEDGSRVDNGGQVGDANPAADASMSEDGGDPFAGRPIGQCVVNSDCPVGAQGGAECARHVPGGFCRWCSDQVHCPVVAFCGPYGACAIDCSSENDCPPGQTCDLPANMCRMMNCVDGQCPVALFGCDSNNRCVRKACVDGCPVGTSCVEDYCVENRAIQPN